MATLVGKPEKIIFFWTQDNLCKKCFHLSPYTPQSINWSSRSWRRLWGTPWVYTIRPGNFFVSYSSKFARNWKFSRQLVLVKGSWKFDIFPCRVLYRFFQYLLMKCIAYSYILSYRYRTFDPRILQIFSRCKQVGQFFHSMDHRNSIHWYFLVGVFYGFFRISMMAIKTTRGNKNEDFTNDGHHKL